MTLTESIDEDAALTWFGELGYCCLGAEALTPILSEGERGYYHEAVLVGRLRAALRQIRPKIHGEAREEALRNVLQMDLPWMLSANFRQSRILASLLVSLLPKLQSGELAPAMATNCGGVEA